MIAPLEYDLHRRFLNLINPRLHILNITEPYLANQTGIKAFVVKIFHPFTQECSSGATLPDFVFFVCALQDYLKLLSIKYHLSLLKVIVIDIQELIFLLVKVKVSTRQYGIVALIYGLLLIDEHLALKWTLDARLLHELLLDLHVELG